MKKIQDFSRKDLKKIATEYALTEHSHANSCICKKYRITSSTFYNILSKAIIEHIVDLNTIFKMMEKSKQNSLTHSGKGAKIRSIEHYNNLLKKRRSFIFNKKATIDIAKKFAYKDQNISKKDFCNLLFIDIELLDKTLINAIINNYINDDIYIKIKENSCNKLNNDNTTTFFNKLEFYRNCSEKFDVNKIYYSLQLKSSNTHIDTFSQVDLRYKKLEEEHKILTSKDFDIEEND
jgi:hypothetical protein